MGEEREEAKEEQIPGIMQFKCMKAKETEKSKESIHPSFALLCLFSAHFQTIIVAADAI